MRNITSELGHIYITADGKKFLYLDDARRHQETLEPKETLVTKIRKNIKLLGVKRLE